MSDKLDEFDLANSDIKVIIYKNGEIVLDDHWNYYLTNLTSKEIEKIYKKLKEFKLL